MRARHASFSRGARIRRRASRCSVGQGCSRPRSCGVTVAPRRRRPRPTSILFDVDARRERPASKFRQPGLSASTGPWRPAPSNGSHRVVRGRQAEVHAREYESITPYGPSKNSAEIDVRPRRGAGTKRTWHGNSWRSILDGWIMLDHRRKADRRASGLRSDGRRQGRSPLHRRLDRRRGALLERTDGRARSTASGPRPSRGCPVRGPGQGRGSRWRGVGVPLAGGALRRRRGKSGLDRESLAPRAIHVHEVVSRAGRRCTVNPADGRADYAGSVSRSSQEIGFVHWTAFRPLERATTPRSTTATRSSCRTPPTATTSTECSSDFHDRGLAGPQAREAALAGSRTSAAAA